MIILYLSTFETTTFLCSIPSINGYLFTRNIIRDQFERIRDGDRFWFENRGNGIFSDEEVAAIRNISIWDIIVNATAVRPHEIQRKVQKESVGKWIKGTHSRVLEDNFCSIYLTHKILSFLVNLAVETWHSSLAQQSACLILLILMGVTLCNDSA